MSNKKSYAIVLLICFALLWSFVGGIVVASLTNSIDFEKAKPLPSPQIPPVEKPYEQEIHDILIVSVAEPKTLLYIEYDITSSVGKGTAHLYEHGLWRSTELYDKSISIDTSTEKNNYSFSIYGDYNVSSLEPNTTDEQFLRLQVPPNLTTKTIAIKVPLIYTPMVIRADKEFSKFGGSTSAPGDYLFIDNAPIRSHVALLKGINRVKHRPNVYSLGILTDWIMYWDKDWNFFHLDDTSVRNPSSTYKSHNFSAMHYPTPAPGTAEYFLNKHVGILNATTDSMTLSVEDVLVSIGMQPGYQGGVYERNNLLLSNDGGIGLYRTLDSR